MAPKLKRQLVPLDMTTPIHHYTRGRTPLKGFNEKKKDEPLHQISAESHLTCFCSYMASPPWALGPPPDHPSFVSSPYIPVYLYFIGLSVICSRIFWEITIYLAPLSTITVIPKSQNLQSEGIRQKKILRKNWDPPTTCVSFIKGRRCRFSILLISNGKLVDDKKGSVRNDIHLLQ